MIKTALRVVMTFGCSVVKKSRAVAAFNNQAGTFWTVVTAAIKRNGKGLARLTSHVKRSSTNFRQVSDPRCQVGWVLSKRKSQTSRIRDAWG